MTRRIFLAALALVAIPATSVASGAIAPETVSVAFLRHGHVVRVERVVPQGIAPEVLAMRELAEGPTRQERRSGIRSALRAGVHLQSIRLEDDVWLARFSRSLLAPATSTTMTRRFAQVEATLRPLGSAQYAAIGTEGRLATTVRLGVWPAQWRPQEGEKGYAFTLRGVQLRLWTLGYLDRSEVSGSLDYVTEQALLAFQGWEGLSRTGTVTGETQVALFRSSRPEPSTHRPGKRVEIHRDQGVLLLIEDNEVRRAVHTSTGSFGRTPGGTFHVYRKELLSWSVPFHVWMPYASYFVGGIAMHEYSYVPAYPASHGCVRLPAGEANRVYAFVEVGTPVYVF
jgi:hypothetical protein